MPNYEPKRRSTLIIPSGTHHDPDKRHLFIVCNDANETSAHFLVSVASWRNELCDSTCILQPGSHEFISVKSYILYRKCRVEYSTTLIRGVTEGIIIPKAPISEELFEAVIAGIGKSPHTPRKLKRYFAKKC